MIISDEKEFIFIHNPKAAGTSVRRALLRFDGRSNFYWKEHQSSVLGRTLDKAHMALDDFRTEFPADFALLDKYFVFVLVRDPYERMVSAYNQTRDLRLSMLTSTGAIAEYTQGMNAFIAGKCTADSVRYDYEFRYFIPQHQMCFSGGQCVADFVGKVEELKLSLDTISRLAGLPQNTFKGLTRSNKRNSAFRAADLLSADSIARVNELYHSDFLHFGYLPQSPDVARATLPPQPLLSALKRLRFQLSD